MRCCACNVALSDAEATFKDENGEFPDMCISCLGISAKAANESLVYEPLYLEEGACCDSPVIDMEKESDE